MQDVREGLKMEQYKCNRCDQTFEDSVVLFTDYVRDEQFYGCPHCGSDEYSSSDACDACGLLGEDLEMVDGCLYCEECAEALEEEE